MGQDLRIQTVGLGQLARGPGKVSDLAGVYCHYRQPGSAQSGHHGQFQAPGGLQHHQGGGEGLQPGHQGVNLFLLVRHAPPLALRAHRHIQLALGYINTYIRDLRFHQIPSSFLALPGRCGLFWPRQLFGLFVHRSAATWLSYGLPKPGGNRSTALICSNTHITT